LGPLCAGNRIPTVLNATDADGLCALPHRPRDHIRLDSAASYGFLQWHWAA